MVIATARRRGILAAVVLAGALAGLLLGTGGAGSQTPPAAPTITSVTPGDGTLTVQWTAPSGVMGITRYDLRHIPTDAGPADKLGRVHLKLH